MEQSDSESSEIEIGPHTTPDTEETRETARIMTLPSCLNRPVSSLAIFFLGVTTAFPGGGLLARMMKVDVESLELLADNDLLMELLDLFIQDIKHFHWYISETLSIPQSSINDFAINTFVSMLAGEVTIGFSFFALLVGGAIGLAMFEMVIKKHGSRAEGKALALAGPLSLVGATAVGALLGMVEQASYSLSSWLLTCLPIFLCLLGLVVFCFEGDRPSFLKSFPLYKLLLLTPLVVMFVSSLILQSKLLLLVPSIPKLSLLKKVVLRYSLTLVTVPALLMLMITDIFNFSHQPTVTMKAPANVSSAVLEGLFVGVLTPQLLMTSVGMSMFLTWCKSGMFKVSTAAIALGSGVIMVVESSGPVLGTGSTIGALMGVAVTAGVSLAAAMAAVDYYGQNFGRCGLVGRLGVMVGAGLGALLTSTNYKLSGVFAALLAAALPAGVYLTWLWALLQADGRCGHMKALLYVPLVALGVLWVYFSLPIQGLMIFIGILLLMAAPAILLVGVRRCRNYLGLMSTDR